eukprot:TRINITY_DN2333_c1_g1_i1.p1 TRINITY_DN2333_c1_g1~~TRINITY_DN2333_c1_g1_i1.p1  ORF type:complete len:413 (-),score=126.18 TRINITY_DN2333_c1_g1_i1:370-1461(-)
MFKFKWNDWVESEIRARLPKPNTIDYRNSHEKLLDQIQSNIKIYNKKNQSSTAYQSLLDSQKIPKIDVTKIFEANADVKTAPSQKRTDPGASEIGIITNGNVFSKIPNETYGVFCSTECYVILNTFLETRKKSVEAKTSLVKQESEVEEVEKWKIWFWQGKDAGKMKWPSFTLGILPFLKDNIIASGAEAPEVEKIQQGKENEDFLSLFEKQMIVVRNTIKVKNETNKNLTDEVLNNKIYDVQKRDGGGMVLIELERDQEEFQMQRKLVFYNEESKTWMVWKGKGVLTGYELPLQLKNDQEEDKTITTFLMSKITSAKTISNTITAIKENEEPKSFFESNQIKLSTTKSSAKKTALDKLSYRR